MSYNDILEQEEIDVLLGMNDEDNIISNVAPRKFDFTYDSIIKDKLPGLELISEHFARDIKVGLFDYLRHNTEVVFLGLKFYKYSEYINTLFMPTCINILNLNPVEEKVLCSIDAKLIHLMVDVFYSGGGKSNMKLCNRDFTTGEYHLIDKMLEIIIHNYERAWLSYVEINLNKVGSEINPSMVNVYDPFDIIIASKFRIELEHGCGEIHICIPYSMIKQMKDKLGSNISNDKVERDNNWTKYFNEEVYKTSIKLKTELLKKKMPIQKVACFKKNDIIQIEMPEDVTLYAESIPVIKGKLGKANDKYGVKITKINSLDDI